MSAFAPLQEVVRQAEAGQLSRAAANAKKALKSHPKHPDWLNAAGVIAQRRGKSKEAEGYFRKAIAAGAQQPSPFRALIALYIEQGRFAEVRVIWDRAERFAWRMPELGLQAAFAQYQQGALEEALPILESYTRVQDGNAEAWGLKGAVLARDGDYAGAIASYHRAIGLAPSAEVYANMSQPYARLGQTEQAMAVLQSALDLDPEHVPALERKAFVLKEQGQLDAAREVFSRLCNIDGAQGPAWYELAELLGQDDLEASLEVLERLLKARRADDPEKAYLALARSTVLKRLSRLAEADEALKDGNRMIARQRPYSKGQEQRKGDAARTLWSAQPWDALLEREGPSPSLIFVMGTIRSGTTLLERMLGNHSGLTGLGEIGLIDRFFRKHGSGATAEDLAALRTEYEARFASGAGGYIDKMPINMRYAGFLRALWPDAKLIHIQRHPNDVAVSIFEALFDSQAQNFSFSEAGIEEYFAEHQRQVAFWQAQGIGMLTLRYEDLVRAPDEQMARVAQYCGFKVEPAMLRPEHNSAAIQTASLLQARRPINTSSIDRWKAHKALLPKIFETWEQGW